MPLPFARNREHYSGGYRVLGANLLKPWDPPDERLYPVVDDLLGNWRRANPPLRPTYASWDRRRRTGRMSPDHVAQTPLQGIVLTR